MSLLTPPSDTEKMQVKINNLSDKQAKNGDEQIEGMSVSDMPEFSDPAILVVREVVKIRYSKKELMVLRESPFSKKKPDTFTIAEVPASILDPERWNIEKKKPADGPSETVQRGSGAGEGVPEQQHRRRTGDPIERLHQIEYDGIVLSPQRRSFNSGCYVPVRESARGTRPHSPTAGKNEPSHIGVREIQSSNNRRIGSGRILRDSWDFGEKSEQQPESDTPASRGRQQRGSSERDDKYERRSFGRDFEITRERDGGGGGGKEGGRRNGGRFDRRRISEKREQEEPEWFSGGPVSQNDTIELRGFDEPEKLVMSKKKVSPSRMKRAKEWSKKKETHSNQAEDKEDQPKTIRRATPTQQSSSEAQPAQKKGAEPVEASQHDEPKVGASASANDHSFNFDDILKCDTFPDLLTNGVGGDGDNMKSRFSRWFKQESPEKAESRCSSMQDEHNIIKDLLSDMTETNVSIPGDSDAYFTPISPADNTGGVIGGKRGASGVGQQSQSISIMDILQRSKQQQGDNAAMKQQPPQFPGKILSLDELEAKMRQNLDLSAASMPQKHQQQKPDEEMTAAFKKLLAQAQASGHQMTSNGPINKPQPMSLLEMLNHSQQQDEAARMSGGNPQLLGTAGNAGMGGLHHPSDLTMKLQAQLQQKHQMEMLNKLINATVHPQQMRTSPLQDMGVQQSRELLNRPEAQAILQGLKRGEITTQHLYQQLANPALQPRHREMLVTILKMQGASAAGTGYGPSPRVLSPVPPHHMFQQQQQQQLRVSPLPPNAMHQRIPSPRELQVHTQNILQRALIKKKLEEQQENYRKKQEMQRGQSPNAGPVGQPTAKSVSSPTPLAFTPTSVLRKMTAEKEEGKENKASGEGKVPPGRPLTGMRPQPPQPQAQQWTSQFSSMKQAGRPIVKANTNYPAQTPEQFFGQHQRQQQQQQRMYPQAMGGGGISQAGQHKVASGGSGQFGAPGQASSAAAGGPQTQYPSQQYPSNQPFAQQLTHQQLRAQHQHRPANVPQGAAGQQPGQQQALLQHQGGPAAGQMGASWQQLFNSSSQATRTGNNAMGSRGGLTDGDLSPTTNQLARWFSPDLLERARGGELPSTAGLAQHVLSLEEIERQTAPPVHN